MHNFGEEIILGSNRIPWLIWIQLIVLILLILLLSYFGLFSLDLSGVAVSSQPLSISSAVEHHEEEAMKQNRRGKEVLRSLHVFSILASIWILQKRLSFSVLAWALHRRILEKEHMKSDSICLLTILEDIDNNVPSPLFMLCFYSILLNGNCL
ncbi:hypothetical protein V2J09_009814 [Rumex salicifolius]